MTLCKEMLEEIQGKKLKKIRNPLIKNISLVQYEVD